MGRRVTVNRIEPIGPKYDISHAKGWFQIAGWFNFMKKFYGHNYGVAQAFVGSFDGSHVKIDTLVFHISKKFISKATGFSLTGERWFKNQILISVNLNYFLKS